MNAREALEFVRAHGIVLESAQGPVPSLAAAIVGAPIRGNWWSHPKGREIFATTRGVRASDDVLVCRLVDGKITFVHRRLWPALVREAARVPKARLARLREVHTASGRHIIETIPFPDWVPPAVTLEAEALSRESAAAALAALGDVMRSPTPTRV